MHEETHPNTRNNKNGSVQNEETHPELRKYTEMLRTVAGSKVGSWLGLSAFNQQAAKDKAIADAEGVCPRLFSRLA